MSKRSGLGVGWGGVVGVVGVGWGGGGEGIETWRSHSDTITCLPRMLNTALKYYV